MSEFWTKEEMEEYDKAVQKGFEEKWRQFASSYTPKNEVSFRTFVKALRTDEKPNGEVYLGEVKGRLARFESKDACFWVWSKNDNGSITEYYVKERDITWL